LVARAYGQAKKSAEAEDRAHALADARSFLARRGRCGSDGACLLSAYVGALQDFAVDGSTLAVPEVSALDLVAAVPAESRALPVREGDCTQTRITDIGGRLEGDKDFESGTSVVYANGGAQVDYGKVSEIIHSRRGDRVLMCLTSIPKHCPPGDARGRFYVTTNLRTRESWADPDSEHMCGGA
jgi:predicted RNA-binding protein with TRAM domain